MWRQCETGDGTYTFGDLLDINEALDVESENKRRDFEWVQEHKKNG